MVREVYEYVRIRISQFGQQSVSDVLGVEVDGLIVELLTLILNEGLLVKKVADVFLVSVQNIDGFKESALVVLSNQLLYLVPLRSYQILERKIILLGLLPLLLVREAALLSFNFELAKMLDLSLSLPERRKQIFDHILSKSSSLKALLE